MAYRLRPAKPFTAEFRSVARDQLTEAIRLLEDQPDGPHAAVHDARKRFKRLRALYRLVQPDARSFRAREDARIRDMARTLSALRDATALVETVDYLATHARSPEEQQALARASAELAARRDRIAQEEHDLPARMTDAAGICREALDTLDRLDLDDDPKKTARRLARAWKRQRLRATAALAGCHEHADAETFHDLRKAGQTYWMHLALLGPVWPSAMRAKQDRAKALVDLLGHEHDLSVLMALVEDDPAHFAGEDNRGLIAGAIEDRRRALRREALKEAQAIFADPPETESAIVALLWLRAVEAPEPDLPPTDE